MAGPILNLIRQLRENRMGGGMGFDRPRMFQPMGAMREPSPAREPATRVGRLLRSIGGGTSRQDYMARRREGMKPLERKTANDAADPDTTYSRLDNSTALSPEEGKKTFRLASQSPAVAATQAPEPIQGGVQDLPAPKPALSRLDELQQQRNAVLARMEGLGTTGFSGDQDPNLYGSVALNNVYNALTGEIEAEEKRAGEKDRMNSQLSELDGLADAAFESGNWAGFETVVNASSAVPKDAKGGLVAELQPDYRGNARPTVARKVTQILRARDGLAGASPEEQNKVLAGIAYAYHPKIDPTLDDSSRYKTSVSERDRIVREMSIHHNLSNDPKTHEYFWALATAAVHANGGTFTQPQSSWWPWSGTSPQNAAAAPPHP